VATTRVRPCCRPGGMTPHDVSNAPQVLRRQTHTHKRAAVGPSIENGWCEGVDRPQTTPPRLPPRSLLTQTSVIFVLSIISQQPSKDPRAACPSLHVHPFNQEPVMLYIVDAQLNRSSKTTLIDPKPTLYSACSCMYMAGAQNYGLEFDLTTYPIQVHANRSAMLSCCWPYRRNSKPQGQAMAAAKQAQLLLIHKDQWPLTRQHTRSTLAKVELIIKQSLTRMSRTTTVCSSQLP